MQAGVVIDYERKTFMNSHQYFTSLSGLRGIGAIWVTIFHVFDQSTNPFISVGYLGVDLFFLLSGFIISHVHNADFAHGYRVSTHWRFLQLRLIRIYPLHAFVLFLFACFVFTAPQFVERYDDPDRFGIGAFISTLLLVHNWGFMYPTLWNLPTWSLSAEWLAYLLFPFISIASSRIPYRLSLPAAFLALVAVEAVFFGTGAPRDGIGKIGLLRIAFEFVAGCLLQRYVSGGRRGSPALLPWAAIGLLLVAIYLPSLQFLALFSFGLLILSVVSQQNLLSTFLSSRPMLFLGDISFSLYMCHWPLIQIRNWSVERGYLGEQAALAVLLVSICLGSILCWKYVEVPARALGRRWLDKSGVKKEQDKSAGVTRTAA